ncbi:MAG: MurR/RpiR family transcriptional regulator [Acidobacteriaceae bacterium]|nr:MurR/RpiR family transcriptional regulator [Acidobacteriaceae bacterium]
MDDIAGITQRLETAYETLAPQLRKAARFIVKSPTEVALYSLREVAARAEVGPTTLIRLAALLGFASYNAFRETFREKLRSGADRYATNVKELQRYRAGSNFERLYRDTGEQIVGNIASAYSSIGSSEIAAAGRIMISARRIYLLGLRSNYCLSFYLYYVLRTFMPNLILLEGRMGMLIDEIGELGPKDAMLAISYDPYALDAVKAVEHAAKRGAAVIAITDTPFSPIARHATRLLVLPTTGTSFYQSLTPTMALIEALICYLAARGEPRIVERVKEEFERRDNFGAYWREGD